jgi:hypothetical protein
MKKLLALFIFQVSTIMSFSQAGCPNVDAGPNQNLACTGSCASLVAVPFETGATSSYEVNSIPYNPPYPFNAGIPAFVGIDDIWSDIIPLPFNFCFFGNTYNQIVIGANGLITFDITNANMYCPWPFTNSIPNPALPLNSISGAYHDIDPSICGNIYYDVFGAAPCRTFVVNFDQVCHFQCNSIVTTQQIVIYETTNAIEVYINDKPTCATWNSGNAVIGIQDQSGTTGYFPPGRNTGPWTATNEAWRFTPNGAPNFTLNWFEEGNPVAISTNDSIDVCPTDTTQYIAQVIYTNCDGAQVIVNDTVTVNVSGGISVQPDVNAPICEGNALQFSSLSGAVQYNWSGPNGFSSVSQNPTIPNAGLIAEGYYIISSVDTLGGICLDSVWVEVNENPDASIISNSPICNDELLELLQNATVNLPDTIQYYAWGITNPVSGWSATSSQPDTSLILPVAGNYNVSLWVETNQGCADSITIQVLKSPDPITNFTYASLCFQQNVFVDQTSSGTPPFLYQWFVNGDTIPDSDQSTFTYTFPDTADQMVTLIVTDASGCISDTAKWVVVKEGVNVPKIPNVLSVSSTVGNDKFDFEQFAPGFNECIDYTFSIYNRWGFKVFETINRISNPDLTCNDCFTGKSYTGTALTEGVYYFLLEGSNGVEERGVIHVFN